MNIAIEWLNRKINTDYNYLEEFAKNVKSVLYGVPLSEIPKVSISSLDPLFKAFCESFEKLKSSSQSSKYSELLKENLKLRDEISITSDLHLNDLAMKGQEIEKLRLELEAEKKRLIEISDVTLSQEYISLKQLKEKDQESYEGEIRELKKSIAESEAQKEKDIACLNKFKSDNIKLFKQNKEMNKQIEENKTNDANFEESKRLNVSFMEQLQKAGKELEEFRAKDIEAKKLNVEEQDIKKKLQETIKQLQNDILEQKSRNEELSLKIANLEAALSKKTEEVNSESSLYVKKAVIALKKAKEVVEKAKSNQPFPVSMPKPPVSTVKRKREAKDKNKEDEMIPEKLQKNQ